MDPNFYQLSGKFVLGLPITGFYVAVIAVALWVVLRFTPIGRYLYAIGAKQKAAELNGIPTRKLVVGAFVASGTLAAVAGVLLASKLRIGQASVGLEFLLPALVGAFLGSTTIKPRRVNVWGHDHRGGDCGGGDFGHPAVWRVVLGRADVQRMHAADCHRHRGICTAQKGCCAQVTTTMGRRNHAET